MARVFGASSSAAFKSGVISGASTFAFQRVGKAFDTGGGTRLMVKNGPVHVLSHGMIGGVSSVLQGGKFGHGFVSAGFTKLISPGIDGIDALSIGGVSVVQAAIAGLVGGTVSAATGGKFSNGFVTAAFGNIFNQQAGGRAPKGPTGNSSPVPGIYFDQDGNPVAVKVGPFGGTVSLDGSTAYDFDSTTGTLINPLSTGSVDSSCPSCFLIGGSAIGSVIKVGIEKFAFWGYGLFGRSGLNIGKYRFDAFYANGRSGGGTLFSVRGPYSRIRVDYGPLHGSGAMGWHSTIRFQVGVFKVGSTAQRTIYPPFSRIPKSWVIQYEYNRA